MATVNLPTSSQVSQVFKTFSGEIIDYIPFVAGAIGAGVLAKALQPAGVVGSALVPIAAGFAIYQGVRSHNRLYIKAGSGGLLGWGLSQLGMSGVVGAAAKVFSQAYVGQPHEQFSQAHLQRSENFSQAHFSRPEQFSQANMHFSQAYAAKQNQVSENYSQAFLAGITG